RLSVHHVGGRNGTRIFPIVAAFEVELISVYYEADPTCLAQIAARNRGLPSELHVLPYCLWSRAETRELIVSRDPYASSLFPFNPAHADRTEFAGDHDYRYGDAVPEARRIPVTTRTLDDILADKGTPPAPDFFSLDIQGAELDALEGGRKALEATTLALQIEVEFLEIYRGQPLFGDICRRLGEFGFEFTRFVQMGRTFTRPLPIGLRAALTDSAAEALFIKRLDHPSIDDRARAKLAFIAIVFGHHDIAWSCLDALPAGRLDTWSGADRAGRRIARFLAAYDAARKATPGFRTWTFTDKWPIAESVDRFGVDVAYDEAAKRLGERREAERARLAAQIDEIRKIGDAQPYGVEKVLIAHDLAEQAEAIKTRRLQEMATLLKHLADGKVF
ncbi:MAG: FkbM family methyltransferase, partial [Alphaproteobacteria bacterium]|nr:FkbM family methyltransferase [Alphaproteobacteria bacterium]